MTDNDDVETLHSDWMKFKLAVPTCGCILISEGRTHVLLVQGYSKSWGFPKGKVNQGETWIQAATREV